MYKRHCVVTMHSHLILLCSLCVEQPGFYSTNWLYLGKCHLQLGRVQEGSKWLRKAADYQSEVGDAVEVCVVCILLCLCCESSRKI